MLAVMTLLSVAPPVEAQDTLSVAARLVMRQPAGIVVRLNAGNELVTGVLDHVTEGSVHLTSPTYVVPLRSITDAWLQRRSTGRGGRIGAVIGAPSGAALFGLGALVLTGLCEYDCEDWGAGEVFVATVIGAATGAAVGYLTGALIGASVPRWERLTEASAPPQIATGTTRRNAGLSAFSITPVVAHAVTDAEGPGPGVSISYLSQLSLHVAVGAEYGRYDLRLEPLTFTYPCAPPDDAMCSNTLPADNTWGVGGLVRLGAGADRIVEPYALVGLGVYDFGRGATLGGYSAGPGIRYRPGSGRIGVSAEGRWHSNFTNSGDDIDPGFFTFGVAFSVLR